MPTIVSTSYECVACVANKCTLNKLKKWNLIALCACCILGNYLYYRIELNGKVHFVQYNVITTIIEHNHIPVFLKYLTCYLIGHVL